MQRLRLSILVPILLLLGRPSPAARSAAEEFELRNGIRVTVATVPKMDRQTTFVVLPLSAFGDGRGEMRRALLIERMMRRSTDALREAPAGMRFGGRVHTTHALQWSMVPNTQWNEGIERHARWLEAGEWRMGELERELEDLEAELAGIAQDPWSTHGTALTAWSQVLRFGSEHLETNAGLENVGELELARWIPERVPVGASLRVFCVGPRESSELESVLSETLGALEPRGGDEVAESDGLHEDPPEEVTWDQPWRHLVYWYPFEPQEPWHRCGAALLVERLNFRFAQHQEDELSDGRARAQLVEPVSGEPMVAISIALFGDARERTARKLLDIEIKDLPKSRGLAFRDQLSMLAPNPQFPSGLGERLDRMYQFMSRARIDEMESQGGALEYGMVAGLLDRERTFGSSMAETAVVAASIEVNDLERYPRKLFKKSARRELLIEPAEAD